ncbi:MAG: hypothetical protein GWN46_25430, partial [Gammaproteobacteria bacterium]|nr:hypothetical protein [Gammaproteobacteria bacterium]
VRIRPYQEYRPVVEKGGAERREGVLLQAHEPPQVGLDALGRPGEQLG